MLILKPLYYLQYYHKISYQYTLLYYFILKVQDKVVCVINQMSCTLHGCISIVS